MLSTVKVDYRLSPPNANPAESGQEVNRGAGNVTRQSPKDPATRQRPKSRQRTGNERATLPGACGGGEAAPQDLYQQYSKRTVRLM